MIESFVDENGEGGLRLTDPENDRKVIDAMLRETEEKLHYEEAIEKLERSNRNLKILCCITTIASVLLFLMLSVSQ